MSNPQPSCSINISSFSLHYTKKTQYCYIITTSINYHFIKLAIDQTYTHQQNKSYTKSNTVSKLRLLDFALKGNVDAIFLFNKSQPDMTKQGNWMMLACCLLACQLVFFHEDIH